MTLLRHITAILCIAVSLLGQAHAEKRSHNYYRDFWSPMFHSQRLNYCSIDRQKCGLALAHDYCKMMGYERASHAIIDYNVGVTNFLLTQKQCKGWTCSGFSLITCVGNFSRKPPEEYYYRSHRFVFPRFDHYRIDWCYQEGRGCGQRAAYSFCRRMGYMNAQNFRKQEHVVATKALGNHKLCFGDACNGFSYITCFR